MTLTISSIPVLESGDRLTRDEFHQRYCGRPDIKKAELVQGVVYVSSPVSNEHGEPHSLVVTWLGTYRARHPELHLTDNGTVLLSVDTEVQPDAALWFEEPGGPHLEGKYIVGAPQLIVEVAASSASYDLHDKLEAYLRAGVHEYIVWRVRDGLIDWFQLEAGEYVWTDPIEGIIESAVFPGLRLNVLKLLTGDLAGVLQTLDLPPRP